MSDYELTMAINRAAWKAGLLTEVAEDPFIHAGEIGELDELDELDVRRVQLDSDMSILKRGASMTSIVAGTIIVCAGYGLGVALLFMAGALTLGDWLAIRK